MATMALLLLIEESGWQAALWGNFRHGEAILRWAHIEDEDLFATVLVGRADGNDVAVVLALARRPESRVARAGGRALVARLFGDGLQELHDRARAERRPTLGRVAPAASIVRGRRYRCAPTGDRR